MQQNILWICSWYPNESDAFIGDFIQRQARAVAGFIPLDVLAVVFTEEPYPNSVRQFGRMTETIHYIQRRNPISDLWRYKQAHDDYLEHYESQHGKPHLIHVHIPMKAGLMALYWKWKYQIPFVLTEHYGIYNNVVEDAFARRNWLFRYATKQIVKQAQLFLPVSQQLGKDVNQWVMEKPFINVPNVVNTELFYFKKETKAVTFQFIHVSNQAPVKNIEGLLEGVRILASQRQDFNVLMIGARIEYYMQLASDLPMVHFIGEVEYDSIATFVTQAKAGLLFSTSESQSCVVLEWLCAGLPVITSAVGGVTELINEDNGLLVESGNSQALADAMQHLMNHYGNYNRAEIARTAAATYSYEAVGMQLVELYSELGAPKSAI